jgi:predicted enzyme related to lactoylglutathione lyase
MIRTGTPDNPGIQGAVVKRTEPIVGKGFYGFECSFSVEDVDKIAAAVEANGGKIVMPKVAIPTVGWLIKFEDTEGNLVGAIRYDQKAE